MATSSVEYFCGFYCTSDVERRGCLQNSLQFLCLWFGYHDRLEVRSHSVQCQVLSRTFLFSLVAEVGVNMRITKHIRFAHTVWTGSVQSPVAGLLKCCDMLWRQGGECRYSSTLSLTSALGGGCAVNAMSRTPYPQEWPGTHCMGGRVGPKAGLKEYGKSRICWDSIPGSSSS